MKKTALTVIALAACLTARPGLCADKTGTGTAGFLKLPVDARSAALGGGSAAPAPGGLSLFRNPASLAVNASPAFAFGHAMLVEDLSYDVLGAAVPLGGGVLGAGAQYLRYGSMDSLDNTGAPAGSLSPRDSAAALGYGLELGEDIFAGAAVRQISSRISGSASTLSLDLGLAMNGDEVNVGVAAQNMGKGLKFNKEESPLPVNVKLGAVIHYSERWQWLLDFNFPKDARTWVGAGAEYAIARGAGWALFGRAGYSTEALDTKELNGLTAGFGLSRGNISIDYAFRTMGMLGSTHHLGLNYGLGKAE